MSEKGSGIRGSRFNLNGAYPISALLLAEAPPFASNGMCGARRLCECSPSEQGGGHEGELHKPSQEHF